MSGFYSFLDSVIPVKRICISLVVGATALLIVMISGINSDFVTSATVADRSFSAFSFMTLLTFIFLMSCEEYAIFKTKRELEHFVDDAQVVETAENFNRKEYLHEEEEQPAIEVMTDNNFRPMDFAGFSNQQ